MCPTHAPSPHASIFAQQDVSLFAVSLNAVIVAATLEEPRVLAVRAGRRNLDALPSGPLVPDHRTLEAGLRAWVEQQTDQRLGYVEQLYTFGDRGRTETDGSALTQGLALAYLALVREARPAGSMASRAMSPFLRCSISRAEASPLASTRVPSLPSPPLFRSAVPNRMPRRPPACGHPGSGTTAEVFSVPQAIAKWKIGPGSGSNRSP
jgi:ADP-ribose pyrophosphatase YjhB (NUDIX family)